jgi:hypothetical protein
MGDLLFIIEFIGSLIVFFYAFSLVARLLKLDDYMQKHQTCYQERIHRRFDLESEYTEVDDYQKQQYLN